AHHSIRIELVQEHVQIERVSKHGIRDTCPRKILLALRVIARKGVLRTRRGALERQIDDVSHPRPCGGFEGIPVQSRTLPWLARPRNHQRGRHASEGVIQRCRLCEVAANHLRTVQLWRLLWSAGHEAQTISSLRQQCSDTFCDTSGSACNQKHLQSDDVNHDDDTTFDGDRSEEHTSELQSLTNLVCRLLLEKKKKKKNTPTTPTYRHDATLHHA